MDAKTGIDQTWLEVRSHPEGEFKPLLFLYSWATQGQNQPVDQVTAAAILKYGQNVHDLFWKIERMTYFYPLSSQL